MEQQEIFDSTANGNVDVGNTTNKISRNITNEMGTKEGGHR